jgi:hypothetical protein
MAEDQVSGPSKVVFSPRFVATAPLLATRVSKQARLDSRRIDTARELSAYFDHQSSATSSVSFLGLFPPKACKAVSPFVSFHRGATQTGILFLVSIERGTSRRVYHRHAWLSDMSQLGGAPRRFVFPWLWHASVCRTLRVRSWLAAPHNPSSNLFG